LYGQTRPGKSAQKIQNTITIVPIITVGVRRRRRSLSDRAVRASLRAGAGETTVLTRLHRA
jgi:hypothetical protein